MHILLSLPYLWILWTLNKIFVTCSRILPVSVFSVLQGDGITPSKFGEMYDMDFVQILWEIRQWKTFKNQSTFVKVMNECIVAQFFRYGVVFLHWKIPAEAARRVRSFFSLRLRL